MKAKGPTLVQPAKDGLRDLFKMLRKELRVQDCVFTHVEIPVPVKSTKVSERLARAIFILGAGFHTRAAGAVLPP
jgi:hypothetical protein